MNIIGISAFFHDSACCLLRDGVLVAAASEERFSRIKHDRRAPVEAFGFCLEAAQLSISDIDAVAYYEDPRSKLARQLWSGSPATPLDPSFVRRTLRRQLGFSGPILTFPHHLSHAASSFFFSGFDEAAILVVDGVGEWATTTYGVGSGKMLEVLEEVSFPHSLGLLYSTITSYLGFRVNDGEYKVMGLAPYGQPLRIDEICQLIGMGPDGQFALNLRYFDFLRGRRMYSPAITELFGQPPRRPEEPITSFHHDVARSLQLVVEEILLEKVDFLQRRTGCRRLCMAGGVALNCVANGRIRRESGFEELFIPPAPGDAGGCLGAAALAHIRHTGERPAQPRLAHAEYGPSYSNQQIEELLETSALPASDFRRDPKGLCLAAATRLEAGDVVAWLQGPMEFGPRALGNRSLLANPMDPDIRNRLNHKVKRRETFRPFAPSVLAAHAADHFDLGQASPFMLETCSVRSALDLPGIEHIDGSARPQTVDPALSPRYAALLESFNLRTGCPILVNTSFNVRGEPIVRSPIDALFCFATTDIDCLVLEDFLIDRRDLPSSWATLLTSWERRKRSLDSASVSHDLYTLV